MWSGVTDASGRRGCESCLPCNTSVSLKLFQDKRNVKEATSASIGRWMNEGGVCVCVCVVKWHVHSILFARRSLPCRFTLKKSYQAAKEGGHL